MSSLLKKLVHDSIIGEQTVVSSVFISTSDIKASYPHMYLKIETRWDLCLRSIRAFSGARLNWSIVIPLDPNKHRPRRKLPMSRRLYRKLRRTGRGDSTCFAKFPLHPLLVFELRRKGLTVGLLDRDGDIPVRSDSSGTIVMYIRELK